MDKVVEMQRRHCKSLGNNVNSLHGELQENTMLDSFRDMLMSYFRVTRA